MKWKLKKNDEVALTMTRRKWIPNTYQQGDYYITGLEWAVRAQSGFDSCQFQLRKRYNCETDHRLFIENICLGNLFCNLFLENT